MIHASGKRTRDSAVRALPCTPAGEGNGGAQQRTDIQLTANGLQLDSHLLGAHFPVVCNSPPLPLRANQSLTPAPFHFVLEVQILPSLLFCCDKHVQVCELLQGHRSKSLVHLPLSVLLMLSGCHGSCGRQAAADVAREYMGAPGAACAAAAGACS